MGVRQRNIDQQSLLGTELLIIRDSQTTAGNAVYNGVFINDCTKVEIIEVGVSIPTVGALTNTKTTVDAGGDTGNYADGTNMTNAYSPGSGFIASSLNKLCIEDLRDNPIVINAVSNTVANTTKKGVSLRMGKVCTGTGTHTSAHWVRYRVYRTNQGA